MAGVGGLESEREFLATSFLFYKHERMTLSNLYVDSLASGRLVSAPLVDATAGPSAAGGLLCQAPNGRLFFPIVFSSSVANSVPTPTLLPCRKPCLPLPFRQEVLTLMSSVTL